MISVTAGKVVVKDKPRQRPTRETVKNFLSANIDLIESYGYSAYIGGSAAYDFDNAADLDFYLTGLIRDYQQLEDLFHYLYEYVLNHCGFLLDLKWVAGLESVVDWNGDPVSANIDFIQISEYTYINDDEKINMQFKGDAIPDTKKVSRWLIQGNWDNGGVLRKPKQLEYFKKHKTLPKIPAREFLKSLG